MRDWRTSKMVKRLLHRKKTFCNLRCVCHEKCQRVLTDILSSGGRIVIVSNGTRIYLFTCTFSPKCSHDLLVSAISSSLLSVDRLKTFCILKEVSNRSLLLSGRLPLQKLCNFSIWIACFNRTRQGIPWDVSPGSLKTGSKVWEDLNDVLVEGRALQRALHVRLPAWH